MKNHTSRQGICSLLGRPDDRNASFTWIDHCCSQTLCRVHFSCAGHTSASVLLWGKKNGKEGGRKCDAPWSFRLGLLQRGKRKRVRGPCFNALDLTCTTGCMLPHFFCERREERKWVGLPGYGDWEGKGWNKIGPAEWNKWAERKLVMGWRFVK